jgi:hypothetical protein
MGAGEAKRLLHAVLARLDYVLTHLSRFWTEIFLPLTITLYLVSLIFTGSRGHCYSGCRKWLFFKRSELEVSSNRDGDANSLFYINNFFLVTLLSPHFPFFHYCTRQKYN